MSRQAASNPSQIKDRTTEYALAVDSGEIVAGPHVRNACKRHLLDLQQGDQRGLYWDVESAAWAIGFFADVLRLNGGEWEGKPYVLLGWQAFIVGSLFGWRTDEGVRLVDDAQARWDVGEAVLLRRFRVAYVETSKGSGKSPLAAGIGLIGLVADGEYRAEVYAAATKKDQAQVLFRDAVAMVDQSPNLRSRLIKSGAKGREWNLAYPDTGSFFRPIASDEGQSGPRPHVALLDEIHEHKTADIVEIMRAGTKSRSQAIVLMITNSGYDKQSVCWDYHEYARQVAGGQLIDDTFFGFVCALDEADDPLHDEACWIKTNPSLPDLPGLKYLREQVVQARGLPAKESVVRRLNFSQWVGSENPLLNADVWNAAADPVSKSMLEGRRCWGGLDLGSTQDLTALVLMFEPTDGDPVWRMRPYFWIPGDDMHQRAERDRVPYIAWRTAGHIEAMPGRAINKKAVLHRLVAITSAYDLQSVGYDRWRIEDLIMLADAEGVSVPFVPFGQGYKDMAPALDEFEQRIVNGILKHDANPVMTWCAANAVADTDPAGNRKLTKRRATGRIDGMVAALMATGTTLQMQKESVYERRGVFL